MFFKGIKFVSLYTISLLVFLLTTAHAATLHSPSYDWFTLQSENFYLHYHDGLEEIANDTLSLAEQIHKRLSKRINWDPEERTHLVLTDEYDFSNGFATPFPNNFTTIFITPPDDLISLEDHAGWIETVLTHEYAHILHLDKVDGLPASLRKLFGRHLLLFPNQFQPRWLVEGYATYIETDRQRGIGRGQSSLYEAMMRAEMLAGFKPLRQLNQPMATWPSGTAAYLYGTYWFEFIEQTYGRQKIEPGLIENHSDNLLPFAINMTAYSTFNKEHLELWDEYENYLNKKFQPQIAAIRKQGLLEGEQLTHDGYFTGPLSTLPNGEVYYIAYNGERQTSLMKIDQNRNIQRLTDVHFGARLDVHPQAGVLLSQMEACGPGQVYVDLYRLDLDGDDMERLTECARYRNAIWSPDGKQILAVKYAKGVTELHLLDEWGKLIKVLWQGKRWEVIGGLDWSPLKNEIIAAVYREQGGWNLEKFDLDNRQWQYVLKDSAIVGYPRYSHDGKQLLFTSEHGRVYNIRQLDIRTGQVSTLTNVLTGALSPAQGQNGDLFYVGYTGKGLDIFHLASKQIKPGRLPKASPGTTGKPLTRVTKLKPQAAEDYSPWESLKPSWWSPLIYIDDDVSIYGFSTIAYDSLLQHAYAVTLAKDSSNDLWLGQLAYVYDALFPSIMFDHTTDYNIQTVNNRLSKIRQENEQKLEMVFPFRGLSSSWSFNLAAIKHEEHDEILKTGALAEPAFEDNIAGLALVYDSTIRPIKSISRTQGRTVSLVVEDSDAISGSDFSGKASWGDWREFIRLGGEHVFALRYVEGKADKTARAFRLGGNSNNETLVSSVNNPLFGSPFEKRSYNLRGYPEGLSQLRGHRMRLASAEYRFPLGRIERGIMVPPIGLDKIHGNLFYEAGVTWEETEEPEPYYRSYGAELNIDAVLFYYIPVQLSLGYAKGLDEGGEDQAYLRLGASF